MMTKKLLQIYQILHSQFGLQYWWPAETRDEIIIGAILTQCVSWQNVETAIEKLKRENLCSLEAIRKAKIEDLSPLIRSTLYFNQKAVKLKNFTEFLWGKYGGILDKMFRENLPKLREELLQIKGIGAETADSIMLYAGKMPVFVVDAYTKRIFSRMKLIDVNWNYQKVQQFFMENLPEDVDLYQDFHAQIIRLGKEYCRKMNPRCDGCSLRTICSSASTAEIRV